MRCHECRLPTRSIYLLKGNCSCVAPQQNKLSCKDLFAIKVEAQIGI